MLPRFVTLALVSFITIIALLGAHQYHTHSQAQQATTQADQREVAKQGSPTFFHTNPFGMPGVDRGVRVRSDSNSYAAAQGLTPPTSIKVLSDSNTAAKPPSYLKYFGLLGLLGLLGFVNRSKTEQSK
ncbi:hypothetical protein GK047_18325 [Paenibacillus sp. SYP-B3998]|uniref:Uncharacterized protein n=1 Tax=Paenibacillus sp. SYP-B3998 TaxID=2678564 RepID=A0A6G4A2B1_9BACL|nr:hypothetical protein [Paenibacillus sp. SYP-B3998]NEW07959.1 hypothetical protein [Paenibacillus sp. SYP-B3998]